MNELHIIAVDRAAATTRVRLAEELLELAKEGKLGIENPIKPDARKVQPYSGVVLQLLHGQ